MDVENGSVEEEPDDDDDGRNVSSSSPEGPLFSIRSSAMQATHLPSSPPPPSPPVPSRQRAIDPSAAEEVNTAAVYRSFTVHLSRVVSFRCTDGFSSSQCVSLCSPAGVMGGESEGSEGGRKTSNKRTVKEKRGGGQKQKAVSHGDAKTRPLRV